MSFNNSNYLSLNKYAKYNSLLKAEDYKNANKVYLESLILEIKNKSITPVKKSFDKPKHTF
jgi:hypothetical protein